jgi:two-component system NarL family sensor kinase
LERDKVINELMVKYETDKLEHEVEEKKIKLQNEQVKSRIRKITIISLIVAIVFILLIIIFLIRASRLRETIYQKEVELKSQEINKLLKDQELKSYAAMLEGQDKERQRIGDDLHDRIGGILSTVKVYFQTIEEKINRLEENTVQQYNKAGELLSSAVNEVRQISHDLSSGVLKNFGLAVALTDLKQTIELTGELKC